MSNSGISDTDTNTMDNSTSPKLHTLSPLVVSTPSCSPLHSVANHISHHNHCNTLTNQHLLTSSDNSPAALSSSSSSSSAINFYNSSEAGTSPSQQQTQLLDEEEEMLLETDIKSEEVSMLPPPQIQSSMHHLTSPESAFQRYQHNKTEEQFCQVCGDRAAGFHQGAFVCEACKKFFSRHSNPKHQGSSCPLGGKCVISQKTRSKCQACRYRKCLQVGMTTKDISLRQDFNIAQIPCRICGCRSSGFHFGAVTCEGCKGFFRRTEPLSRKLVCRAKNECSVTFKSRNICKSCRYKKCLQVGMSKKCSRIGRQPNAVKYHCAQEIDFLRSARNNQPDPSTSNPAPSSTPQYCSPSPLLSPCSSSSSPAAELLTAAAIANQELANQNRLEPSEFAPGQSSPVSSSPASSQKDTSTAGRNLQVVDNDEEISVLIGQLDGGMTVATLTENMPEDLSAELQWFRSEMFVFISQQQSRIRKCEFLDRIRLDRTYTAQEIWGPMMNHFNYHSQNTVEFVKKIPGFQNLNLTVKRHLVREAMYSLMLLSLSENYRPPPAEYYNYFDFTPAERNVIISIFPSFVGIDSHLANLGRLIYQLRLTQTQIIFLKVMQIFKKYSTLEDYPMLKKMFLFSKIVLFESVKNNVVCKMAENAWVIFKNLDSILDHMNEEHHSVIYQLTVDRPYLVFPELYVEMFYLIPDESDTHATKARQLLHQPSTAGLPTVVKTRPIEIISMTKKLDNETSQPFLVSNSDLTRPSNSSGIDDSDEAKNISQTLLFLSKLASKNNNLRTS